MLRNPHEKQPLSFAGLHALRDEFTRTIEPARTLAAETLTLERRLSAELGVQNAECPAEIALTWQTAPAKGAKWASSVSR
jgi:hypothetical protein